MESAANIIMMIVRKAACCAGFLMFCIDERVAKQKLYFFAIARRKQAELLVISAVDQ